VGPSATDGTTRYPELIQLKIHPSGQVIDSKSMIVAVVDDDADVRAALNRLLHAMDHEVRLFASAEEFAADPATVDCLILDVRLPGLNGLELREQMHAAGRRLPLVFITGDGDRFLGDGVPADVPTLRKPFDEDLLAAALDTVVSSSRRDR
jgi:FixJ family two-component response regulator